MRLYVAGILKKEMEVDSNLPFKIPFLSLKWAEGQVGALPVFETLEQASEYCGSAPMLSININEEDVYAVPTTEKRQARRA